MRLTVHVINSRKAVNERNTKNGTEKFNQTFTTLSYPNVNQEDVNVILNDIKKNKLGEPFKHYLSNEKIAGHSRGKRKK